MGNKAKDTTPAAKNVALSDRALAKYLPVFAVLVVSGLVAIAFLPLLWREPGDSPLVFPVTLAFFAGLAVATAILAVSLLFPHLSLKYASALAITLIGIMFFTLSSSFYYNPTKTWSVGVATMVLVASGTVLPNRRWVLVSVLFGWIAFIVPSVMLWRQNGGDTTVTIFWRTYSMMLLFSSLNAFFIHRYVHTYITSLSGLTERAVLSAESDKLTGLLNRNGLENLYAVLSGKPPMCPPPTPSWWKSSKSITRWG